MSSYPDFVLERLEKIATRAKIPEDDLRKELEEILDADFIMHDPQFEGDDERLRYSIAILWTRYIMPLSVNEMRDTHARICGEMHDTFIRINEEWLDAIKSINKNWLEIYTHAEETLLLLQANLQHLQIIKQEYQGASP